MDHGYVHYCLYHVGVRTLMYHVRKYILSTTYTYYLHAVPTPRRETHTLPSRAAHFSLGLQDFINGFRWCQVTEVLLSCFQRTGHVCSVWYLRVSSVLSSRQDLKTSPRHRQRQPRCPPCPDTMLAYPRHTGDEPHVTVVALRLCWGISRHAAMHRGFKNGAPWFRGSSLWSTAIFQLAARVSASNAG